MIVSTRGHMDVLVRERDENIISFTKKVVEYASNLDISTSEFCTAVGVENVSLNDAAQIYATVHRQSDSNVIRFEERKPGKIVRYPLWREEALG